MTRIEIDNWLKQVPMSELVMLLLACGNIKRAIDPWNVIEQDDGIVVFQNRRWKQAERRQLVVHEQQLNMLSEKIFALMKDDGVAYLLESAVNECLYAEGANPDPEQGEYSGFTEVGSA